MRRLLSPALCLSLAACSTTPAPPVRTPPPVSAPEPAPVEPADAGAPLTPVPAVADADAATPPAPAEDASTAAPTPTTPTAPTAPTTRPTTPAAGNPVAQGRAVFVRVCGRCHEGGDDEGPNPNLRWPEARMRTLVRNGNSRMRAIPASRLSDADLTLVVGYLRSIRAIQ